MGEGARRYYIDDEGGYQVMKALIYRGSGYRGPYESGACKCGRDTTCKVGKRFVCSVCQWHNKQPMKEQKVA